MILLQMSNDYNNKCNLVDTHVSYYTGTYTCYYLCTIQIGTKYAFIIL